MEQIIETLHNQELLANVSPWLAADLMHGKRKRGQVRIRFSATNERKKMKVLLRDIDENNFKACVKLSTRKDQPFVATNAYSIAESKIFPYLIINAIYSEDEIVGFMMYAKFYEKEELYLYRFMIDQRFQGKGYGKAALGLLKEIAEKDENISRIKLSTAPDNSIGILIYERFGFVDMQYMKDGEKYFVLELNEKLRGAKLGL